MTARKLRLIITPVLVAGCLQAADDSRLDESRALVQSFGARLQSELQQSLAEGGPVGAISVCKNKAPQIASELSRQSGAKVRRTSLRFRNPANVAEPWESRVLQAFDSKAASGADAPLEYFARQDDGTVRYMAAIRTGAVCLACHGAFLSPEMDAIIDADYPHDRARGYRPGDIRGAFSVTWPPSDDASSN
ncbi:MAG: DUF3365 domain-containing protein [Gammaproteobacteria bacterium]|nr:DUF3365 domain-containing protein [Gammaproteobacteria bacterium]MDH3480923.1 DUF3365 domain-containing protein [Gammaproteobacteria bacterium]